MQPRAVAFRGHGGLALVGDADVAGAAHILAGDGNDEFSSAVIDCLAELSSDQIARSRPAQ
jgi:hypothetical protein